MEILAWSLIGFVAYIIIGNIVACCMKLAEHKDIRNESDFKVVAALWPAPILLYVLDCFIISAGYVSKKAYEWVTKWKS